MSTGLERRQHVAEMPCVPGGSLQPIPTSPLTRQERAVPHLRVWVLYGWRVLGPGHGFTISELFFCPSAGLDKSDLSLLAPDYLQRRGVACKLSLGEGLPSGHL